MPTHDFEIEFVFPPRGGSTDGYVLVRTVAEGDFAVPEGSTLDGRSLRAGLTAPRALRPDGTPRTDLFALHFVDPEDAEQFREGQAVTLEWIRDVHDA